jgi:hypothetical protein
MSMHGGQSGREMGGESSLRTPNISASELVMYLKNVSFPADKTAIINAAKSAGAPENIVQWLNRLPDKQYSRTAEVEQEFSKLK